MKTPAQTAKIPGVIALATLLGLLPATAEAADAPLFTCASAESVAAQLKYCSDNVDAVNLALDCYDQLANAWDSTAEELNKTLKGNQERTSTFQQGEMAYSESDYKTAQAKMQRLVDTTKFNLGVISQYSHSMLDYVGATSEATSATCYNENLERLHTVQKDLEKMIQEGEAAIQNSHGLENIASGFKATLGGSEGNSAQALIRQLPKRAAVGAAPPKVTGGNSRKPASDITGTERSREKEILSTFALEGQLQK